MKADRLEYSEGKRENSSYISYYQRKKKDEDFHLTH